MRSALFVATLASAVLTAVGGPCDVFASGGTPCVAAHSVTRALFANYSGRLYQVNRTRDGALLDIHALTAGGYADAAAQDAFCGTSPLRGVPALGTIVHIVPAVLPSYSFRHCDAVDYVTETEGSGRLDHAFTLVAALNGDAAAVSFRSVNLPTSYVAPVAGAEPGRVGVVKAPPAADASWTVTPSPTGGVTLSLPAGRGALAVGQNLTGTCAHGYEVPAASVYLLPEGSSWSVVPAAPANVTCIISVLYDQTARGNDLGIGPPGGRAGRDSPVDASRLPLSAAGHAVYAAYFMGGMGYRKDVTDGVAQGNAAETIYMVTSGVHFNAGCCLFVQHGRAASTRARAPPPPHPQPLPPPAAITEMQSATITTTARALWRLCTSEIRPSFIRGGVVGRAKTGPLLMVPGS